MDIHYFVERDNNIRPMVGKWVDCIYCGLSTHFMGNRPEIYYCSDAHRLAYGSEQAMNKLTESIDRLNLIIQTRVQGMI